MKKLLWVVVVGFCVGGCTAREPVTTKEETRNFVKEGVESLTKKDVEGALRSFEQAIVQDPRNEKAHFILAQTLMHIREYQRAAKSFMAVVKINPDNGEAYLLLGGCFDLMGNKDEAIKNVQKSVEIFQRQRDEERFKQSVVILHRLMGVNDSAGHRR